MRLGWRARRTGSGATTDTTIERTDSGFDIIAPDVRDETIGPNEPPHDIAGGPASQGLARIHYAKRTLAARDQSDFKALTINDV
jgi:hypothetical protein